MRPRPDLLDASTPDGIEVFQLTTEDVPHSHIYMEAQIFLPDSSRFVLHRSAHAHGSDRSDPEHRYLMCDVESGALTPVTSELGTTGPSVSPDGRYLYYFVDETGHESRQLILKRLSLESDERETVCVIDGPLAGTNYRPSRIYPLSTISSDGQRLAISCFLGEDFEEEFVYGLLVFDLESGEVRLILEGPSWCNIHPQYCRSTDTEASHDLLVQENHGNIHDETGAITRLVGGEGADIHVIRDDGTNFRTMPWGRDGNEACQGHQCWRGRSTWAITGTGNRSAGERQLIEGTATADYGHVGLKTPNATRNDLSASFDMPDFSHFATDVEGNRFITDCGPFDERAGVYFAELGEAGKDPLRHWVRLANPKSNCGKAAHIHPFLSPDGNTGFFNSDESGILQAYMIRGLGVLHSK